ncbi:synaptonemal complex protein 2-like [Centrocercus urophasianus]|uniref:synaptonemal complex protein 2-like n=1 Tax=Centrocercus urophasianus TaxID=9002 RepID=UPI001C649FAF|nr:synaptonemal complex protein 2-like [Centrocercus urophasianus]
MVNWYEKLKGILILRGNEKNKIVTNLAEDFFNVLLIVYDSRPEGKMEMLENFVLRTCTIITDVRINIYVQQEVVRKLNLMLDSMPRDARKKIFSTEEMLLVMSDMGRRILDAGDYDLQVAITEALCRMIPEKQRRELACQWFSMEFVSNAFKGIKDSEFETDCRKFLNQVNGMLGDKRSYSSRWMKILKNFGLISMLAVEVYLSTWQQIMQISNGKQSSYQRKR